MRFARTVVPMIVVAALVACGGGKKKEAPTPDPGATTEPGSPTGAVAEPPKAEPTTPLATGGLVLPSMDKFRMGRDMAADGGVGTEVDRILPSEKLFVSFVVKNPWPQMEIKVTWRNLKSGKVAGEESKPLPASGPISFEAKGAGSWERGSYKLEITMSAPGKPTGNIGSKDFELISKR